MSRAAGQRHLSIILSSLSYVRVYRFLTNDSWRKWLSEIGEEGRKMEGNHNIGTDNLQLPWWMKLLTQSHVIGVTVSWLCVFPSRHRRRKGGCKAGLWKWSRWNQRLLPWFLNVLGYIYPAPHWVLYFAGAIFSLFRMNFYWPFSWGETASQEVQELRLHPLTMKSQSQLCYQIIL